MDNGKANEEQNTEKRKQAKKMQFDCIFKGSKE